MNFRGGISAHEFKENLQFIRDNIGDSTKLIIINGCEVISPNDNEKEYHIRHKELNCVVDDFVSSNDNTMLLDVRKFVKDSSDLNDNIRHYQRQVYFQMAQELIKLIGEDSGVRVKSVARRKLEGYVRNVKSIWGILYKRIRIKKGSKC